MNPTPSPIPQLSIDTIPIRPESFVAVRRAVKAAETVGPAGRRGFRFAD
jgi:hypothetical protein